MIKRTATNRATVEALVILRRLSGTSLNALEAYTGVSQQAISKWETGKTQFPEDKIDAYLKGIGCARDDLDRQIIHLAKRIAEHLEPESNPYEWATPLPKYLDEFSISDEIMSPWAEPGETLYYQRDAHPKRHQGCLIEPRHGKPMARIFVREADGFVFFKTCNPDATDKILHSEIKAIHKIVLRGG